MCWSERLLYSWISDQHRRGPWSRDPCPPRINQGDWRRFRPSGTFRAGRWGQQTQGCSSGSPLSSAPRVWPVAKGSNSLSKKSLISGGISPTESSMSRCTGSNSITSGAAGIYTMRKPTAACDLDSLFRSAIFGYELL